MDMGQTDEASVLAERAGESGMIETIRNMAAVLIANDHLDAAVRLCARAAEAGDKYKHLYWAWMLPDQVRDST